MILTFVITYECSKGCRYCFQGPERAFGLPPMSLEDFIRALHWLRRANLWELKITGGEPTQHPEFVTFCELARDQGMRITLLTNGHFDFRSVPHLDVLAGAFVHIRPGPSLRAQPQDQVLSSIEFLQSAAVPVVLSYTITEPGRLREMVELAKSLRRAALRIDLARWDLGRSNEYVPADRYHLYRNEILEAVDLADSMGIALNLDCPLPLCMFSKKEREILRPHGLRGVCASFPLVNPDLSVGCCPYPGLLQRRVTELQPDALCRRLQNHQALEVLRWRQPLLVACETCPLWRARQCQGGCIRGKPILPKEASHALPFQIRPTGGHL